MKVMLELSPEDIRNLIRSKVRQEASKHNHPDAMNVQITVFSPTGERGSLEDLSVEIHAVFEEKPKGS